VSATALAALLIMPAKAGAAWLIGAGTFFSGPKEAR
jgi:hypothetical protein